MKKLLIAAMIPDLPSNLEDFTEIWGINRLYARIDPKRINRLYYFDNHKLIDSEFVEKVNAMPWCRVVTKWPDPQIPTSEAYPLDAVIERFGTAYFPCSVAYAIAHAVYEGWKDITLAGMYHIDDSWEYVAHKAAVEFWCGAAIGSGAHLTIHGDSMLLRPHSWESEVYGYETNDFRRLYIDTLAAAYTACNMYPLKMLRPSPPEGYKPQYVSIRQRLDADIPMQEETLV